MVERLIQWAKQHGAKIAAFESFTGGMFANMITNIAGSSDVFAGSIVGYSNDFKVDIGDINPETLKKYGAVSIPTITEMLKNTYKKTGAHVVFAFTGNAPSSKEDDKLLSFVGFLLEKKMYVYEFYSQTPLTREEYKESAINWVVNKFMSKVTSI